MTEMVRYEMDYVLDDELAALVTGLPALTEPGLADVAAMREHVRRMMAVMPRYEPRRQLDVTELKVPGHQGAPDVTVRVYAPAARERALPGLIYLHGGAYVFGGLDTADNAAAPIADRAGVIVVSVDYRLAPEHPYPAALDDCYAVLEWLAGSAASGHGIDIGPLGVLGEGSGGGLAAALALLTKDRGGPELTAQFLDAPMIDDRLLTHSMLHLPVTPAWRVADSVHSWAYYLRGTAEPGSDEVPVYAAPARADLEDVEGLPPAWICTYQVDPTRDEGLDYARLLMQAGVPTELQHHGSSFHLAHALPGTRIGARMITNRIDAIRRLLPIEP
jgi:acetyl esterase